MASGVSIKSVVYLTHHIKPDMDKRLTIARVFQAVSLVVALASFVAFMVMSMSGLFNEGVSRWYIAIPFFTVPISIIAFALWTATATTCRYVTNFILFVKQYERVLIVQLLSESAEGDAKNLNFINKLIETKNLAEYKVVADVLIVKKYLLIGDDEARAEYEEYIKTQTAQLPNAQKESPNIVNAEVEKQNNVELGTCPACGAQVEDGNKFCQYCGRKLK